MYGPYPLIVLEECILLRSKKGSRQSDDNIKSEQNRFRTFEEMNVPVVETLQKISTTSKNSSSLLRVHDIDGNVISMMYRMILKP